MAYSLEQKDIDRYYYTMSNNKWLMDLILDLQLIPSNLRNNKAYVTWYIVSLYFVVMNFVPFTLLAILNVAIYKQVRSKLFSFVLRNFNSRTVMCVLYDFNLKR
jgi:hypothetical protein